MCLVAQKVMEIPVLYDRQVILLSCTEEPANTTLLARSILRLRFLVHWRKCWDHDPWQDAIAQPVASYSRAITECCVNEEMETILWEREEQCKRIISMIHRPDAHTDNANQAVLQALKLATEGAPDLSVAILNRMLSQQDISNLDTISALRALTKIHLAEGDDRQALNASKRLLLYPESTGTDYLLAATCCLNSQDYEQAINHLEVARELGIPFTQLKGMAARIAGLTGDPDLVSTLGGK